MKYGVVLCWLFLCAHWSDGIVFICFISGVVFEVCWVVCEVFIGKLVFDVVLGCERIVGLERSGKDLKKR